MIKTKRNVEEVDNAEPFRFTVTARDNPNATVDYNTVEAPLIVNLIGRLNRLILAIGDAKPDEVASKIDTVTQVIQEQSGLIIGVEKLNVREFVGENGTLEIDPAGTDIWFYAIDPETDTILPVNHSLVQK